MRRKVPEKYSFRLAILMFLLLIAFAVFPVSVSAGSSTIVMSKGRKIIGWDEIMQGGLHKDATVMCWRDVKYGIEAALAGNEVIMTPMEYLYLDKYQNPNHLESPVTF